MAVPFAVYVTIKQPIKTTQTRKYKTNTC